MTQKFGNDGTVIPVTKVVAGPCFVTQVKNQDRDGYTAIQVGFGAKKKLSKSIKGHLKNLGSFRYLKEFRVSDQDAKDLTVGNKITAATFKPGDKVKVTGVTKGRGFQGVVKRHGFHGSPKTHGHKDQLRMPGSIGATGPQHVFKGTRMGGQMGSTPVTVTNLEIVEVDGAKNEIFIKGALPGARNNLLLISGVGDLITASETQEQKTAISNQKTEISDEQSVSKPKPIEVKSEAEAPASASPTKAMSEPAEVKTEAKDKN